MACTAPGLAKGVARPQLWKFVTASRRGYLVHGRSGYASSSISAIDLEGFRKRAETAIKDGDLDHHQEEWIRRDSPSASRRRPSSGARGASTADERYQARRPDGLAMAARASEGARDRERAGALSKSSDLFSLSRSLESIPQSRADYAAARSEQSAQAGKPAQQRHRQSSAVRYKLGNRERVVCAHEHGITTHPVNYPYRGVAHSRAWIKDHCQCPKCIQPSTSQKLNRTGDAASLAREMTPIHLVLQGSDVLHVDNVSRDQDHTYIIPTQLMASNALTKSDLFRPTHWMGADLGRTPGLRISWPDLDRDAGLFAATVQLVRYGLVVITDVPTDNTSDQACALRQVAHRFGEIRNVFYGQTWDVKSIANSKNIAYTDVDLGLHMDLCYFESPPRYQLLHCLRNRVDGGSSYFVDSYHAAEQLRSQQPEVFQALCRTPVPFHYDNDGYYYSFEHPTIKTQYGGKGDIQAVNYSPPFQGPWLPSKDSSKIDLPTALHEFEKLLDRPEAKYEFTMREGDLVLFDNRRVLHARRAFKNKAGAETLPDGEATRWLKGCYIDGDVIRNKMRTLTRSALNGEFEVSKDIMEVVKLPMRDQSFLDSHTSV